MQVKVHEVLKESMQGKAAKRFTFDEVGGAGSQHPAGAQISAGPESTLQS